ncbi:hypothetical protein Micbo1qcDRAFT_58502 [Microdochium bolleyi]|uniref:Homeobox domain-containing protein n=1 Tax=Microdochium bolleyi TaxID=196109 RepID=A0A136J3W5_9PEZI|nr:hypothetical protein Micbo1qcDRAFT_58502 [Microdochium bolleyi]
MNMHFDAHSAYAGPMYNFAGGPAVNMQYSEAQFPAHPGFGLQYMYPYQDRRSQIMTEHAAQSDNKAESKPRLSKEEVDKLEKIFQQNPKPSSSAKAELADQLKLERPRINNWFQNRRAKAKQERKQAEYEAEQMAQKELSSGSTPKPLEEGTAAARPGYFAAPVPRRMNLSTALFPSPDTCDEDASENNTLFDEEMPSSTSRSDISSRDSRTLFYTSPSLDLHAAQAHVAAFSPQSMSSPNFGNNSIGNYTTYMASAAELQQIKETSSACNQGLPSPEEDDNASEATLRAQYNAMQTRRFSGSMSSPTNPDLILRQSTGSMSSLKSPHPQANLATRRNIARPAALQDVSLKSRATGTSSTPKTALDGSRRLDPSSPATSLRRISTAGTMSGRIQKSVAGPRSPMYFGGRNTETRLQYHHTRSPASSVGPLTSPFSAAPTTPITPAVTGMQSLVEPEVTMSTDEDSLLMSSGTPLGFLTGIRGGNADVKTPPGTSGLILNSAMNFPMHHFAHNAELVDQPQFTPYFQADFSELAGRGNNMPSYLELTGSSLPSTPLYPHNMTAMQDGSCIMNQASSSGAQSDWDAAESVTSSRSSPGMSQQAQIHHHCSQSMTPHDYSSYER